MRAKMDQKTPLLLVLLLFGFNCQAWCQEAINPAPSEKKKEVEKKTGDLLIGAEAPDFTLTDALGKEFRLSDHSDKIVVLEWISPDCPFSKRLYIQLKIPTLARQYIEKGVVWVTMTSDWYSHPINLKKWLEARGISYPMLLDKDGKVGESYHATSTPEFYVIDRGKVVYHGALDDDIWGRKSQRTEFLANALEQLTSGKKVNPQSSRLYGKTIRYLAEELERKARLEELRRKAREAQEKAEKEKAEKSTSGEGG